MKKIIVYATLLAIMLPATAVCQSKKNILREAQRIQDSEQYYWGIGTSSTSYEEADNHALGDLQSQLHVRVGSYTNVQINQEQQGHSVSSKTSSNIVIETSTGGVLTNTKRLILSEGPEWRVMRYVERDKVEDGFIKRVDRVKEYLHDAKNSEASGRMDNALRKYYWAYCLLRSLPNPESYTSEINFKKVCLMQWIPEHLDYIFQNLKIEAGACEDSVLNLVAKYEGQDVTSLDIQYSIAGGNKKQVDFKDGIAQIGWPQGTKASSFLVDYEYKYEDRSLWQGSEELQLMIAQFKDAWPKSQCMVQLGTKKEQKTVQKTFQQSVMRVSEATNAIARVDDALCDHTVKAVLEAIRSRKYESVRSLFTSNGFEMFQQLIAYGNARLLGKPNLRYYEGADGKTICRSIPMNFSFKNNHITFTEEVTLTLNPEGRIESLAFSIDNDTRQAIFETPARWSDSVRMAIATFLENYKTAYALKRLEFIRSIFDDYTIIVTGTVTTSARRQNDSSMKLKQNVKYTKYNKEQYIERLEQQFKKNQFINLRFTDVTMAQVSNDNDFALRIKQDYFSSSYADTGYLFLMVDMNDTSRPLIKLRAWQPHRDPEINPHLPEKNPFYGLIYEGNYE